MGWGRMLLLGNLGQQLDIHDQQEQIQDLQSQLSRLRSQDSGFNLAERVDRLEAELDEMRLYVAALIRYLGQRGGLDKAEFARLVDAIDGQDGAADGGYRGPVSPENV